MSDKKRGPNLKETLEEKKKKLEAMKERNKKATTDPSRPDISNVTNLDDALKLAESLNGRKSEIASPEPVRKEVKTEASSHESTPSATTPIISHRRRPNLSMKFEIAVIDIPPKERETYSKSTQTSTDTETELTLASSPSVPKEIVHAESSLSARSKSISEDNSNNSVATSTTKEPEQKDLTQDEKDAIVQSTDFVSWFSKTSKLVERALYASKEYDITVDYSAFDENASRRESKVREVTLETKLFDERWSKHRAVTDIAWSPKFADLVVASYSANEQGGNDPDGVVLVWSVHNALQRPEFRFHCQSPVVSVFFDEFSPTLVVGGTYSGQIVLWDTRAKTTPIQHTPLSSVGHTHPVYSMDIVGSKNAHNLVTVSTDGKLCVWNLENLLQPLEVLELHNKQSKQVTVTAPVAVTSLAFPEAEVNSFFVGSEEGAVYEAFRHGTKQGIYERYDGHHGPITSIDFHNGTGALNFSDLFITASTDWTCKLWSQKHGQKPIYSFEGTGDYVYDARWCPSHPAVFATVDGTGSLDLWNLNEETEIPILHTPISQRALNKIRWSADGKRILAGDADGTLHIYGTGELSVPRSDEWTLFEETLSKLSNLEEDAGNEKKETLLV